MYQEITHPLTSGFGIIMGRNGIFEISLLEGLNTWTPVPAYLFVDQN